MLIFYKRIDIGLLEYTFNTVSIEVIRCDVNLITTPMPAEPSACGAECLRIKITRLWWKKQMQFPKLWALARQVMFAISSIQRWQREIISAAGCTVSARRTARSSENVDDILFIYIRIEFIDYFVTVGIIAHLYAILTIYDVLIVFCL